VAWSKMRVLHGRVLLFSPPFTPIFLPPQARNKPSQDVPGAILKRCGVEDFSPPFFLDSRLGPQVDLVNGPSREATS